MISQRVHVLVAGPGGQLFDNRRRKVHTTRYGVPSTRMYGSKTLCGRIMQPAGRENWVETDAAIDCKACLAELAHRG